MCVRESVCVSTRVVGVKGFVSGMDVATVEQVPEGERVSKRESVCVCVCVRERQSRWLKEREHLFR